MGQKNIPWRTRSFDNRKIHKKHDATLNQISQSEHKYCTSLPNDPFLTHKIDDTLIPCLFQKECKIKKKKPLDRYFRIHIFSQRMSYGLSNI